MFGTVFTLLCLLCAVRSDGTRVAYTSFAGVDPNALSCDPAGQVFLLLPHFEDCNKFYMCAHGQEVEFTCGGPTLVFDFELQTCAWPWQTVCRLRSREVEGSGDDAVRFNYQPIQYEEEQARSAPVEAVVAAALATVESPTADTLINCQRLESATTRVPYKGDCQRYWRCTSGTPEARYCADGLYFNARSQQCDHEVNVKCDHNTEVERELMEEFIVYH